MRARKKPVEINVWLIGPLLVSAAHSWSDLPEEVRKAYESGCFVFFPNEMSIRTLEGVMVGSSKDYLVEGVNGEFYPIKPDIFEKTYDVLD